MHSNAASGEDLLATMLDLDDPTKLWGWDFLLLRVVHLCTCIVVYKQLTYTSHFSHPPSFPPSR